MMSRTDGASAAAIPSVPSRAAVSDARGVAASCAAAVVAAVRRPPPAADCCHWAHGRQMGDTATAANEAASSTGAPSPISAMAASVQMPSTKQAPIVGVAYGFWAAGPALISSLSTGCLSVARVMSACTTGSTISAKA
jgi:hypothetical protein